MKCFIYTRRSSEDKKRQVASIPSQIEECTKLAESNGLEVIQIFEESKSAKDPGRPLFDQMIKRVYNGEAQIIVVWELHRLSRNPIDAGAVTHYLMSGQIKKILTPIGEYDQMTSPLLLSVKFGIATEFIVDLKRQTKRGMLSRASKGYFMTNPPYGYSVCKDQRSPDYKKLIFNHETIYAKQIFKMYSTGKYSINELTKKLIAMGAVGRLGGALTKGSVNKVINNTVYYGEFTFKGEDYKGNHTPLVTKELWDQCQAVAKGRSITKTTNHEHLYAKRIKIGKYYLSGEIKKGYTYYRNARVKGVCLKEEVIDKCIQKTLEDNPISKNVIPLLEAIKQTMMDDSIVESIDQQAVLEKELKKIKKQILESQVKLSKGVLDDEDYISLRKELKRRKGEIEMEMNKNEEVLDDEIIDTAKKFQIHTDEARLIYKDAPKEERAKILDSCIDSIVLTELGLDVSLTGFYSILLEISKRWGNSPTELDFPQSQKGIEEFVSSIFKDGTPPLLLTELLNDLRNEHGKLNNPRFGITRYDTSPRAVQ